MVKFCMGYMLVEDGDCDPVFVMDPFYSSRPLFFVDLESAQAEAELRSHTLKKRFNVVELTEQRLS